MTVDDLFDALRNGSEEAKAAAEAFFRHPDNLYRIATSPEFVQAAVTNADLFGIDEDEDEDEYAIDDETECPHCGQPLHW